MRACTRFIGAVLALGMMTGTAVGADDGIVGVWKFPGNAVNVPAVFVFHADGTMLWCSTALGQWSTSARWSLDNGAFPAQLDIRDFSDPSLRGSTIAAICNIAGADLHLEFGAPSATRPSMFSGGAEVCTRADAEQVAVLLATRSSVAAVQPDGTKWAQVKVGMTQAEVVKLLGSPIEQTPPHPAPGDEQKPEAERRMVSAAMKFGHISMPSPSCPADYQYMVFFSDEGVVYAIDDPMGQKVSLDGRPTVPALLLPADQATFSHYPRFVDLRWMPSSGTYPMGYEVQVAFSRGGDGTWVPEVETATDIPCYTFVHAGANQGRWRVRARNAKGASPWSAWWAFAFAR